MAIFNGTDLILKCSISDGGAEQKMMHSQNVSISMNADTIDVSTKDSAGYRALLGGQKSFSLSADGLMDFNSTGTDVEVDELFDQWDGRTAVTFTFTLATTNSGDYFYTGSGFITSIEVSGGTEDAPTYSATIEGTGALIQNDVA